MSSYFLFSNERRIALTAEAKAANPDGKTDITKSSKIISAEWKAIDPEVKKGYEERAKAAKVKYLQDMEAYKQTDNYKEFAKKFAAWKEQEAEEKASGKNKKKNGKKSPKKAKSARIDA